MTERERILDRLTKLVALAGSPNRNEAATANRMAETLMAKHGLSKKDVTTYKPPGFYELPMGTKGFETAWKFSLVTATARFCGCEAISLQVGMRRKVRIAGERENVERAAGLFESLLTTLRDLEKLEASWLANPSVLVYSDPKEYADSFRRGATVAIIEMMQQMRPENFGLRRRKAAGYEPPVATATTAPVDTSTVSAEASSGKTSWFAKVWPWSKRSDGSSAGGLLTGAEPKEPQSQSLVVVEASKKEDHKERVKAKYKPRQVKLDLENAEDEGAYWRGYQSARRLVVLPTDKSPVDPGSNASPSDGDKAKSTS